LWKVYNKVTHSLLLKILEIYGTPTDLVDVIRHMFDNNEIEISSGKENRFIDYLTGVQQAM
jgi:hypothetical protein